MMMTIKPAKPVLFWIIKYIALKFGYHDGSRYWFSIGETLFLYVKQWMNGNQFITVTRRESILYDDQKS